MLNYSENSEMHEKIFVDLGVRQATTLKMAHTDRPKNEEEDVPRR